MPKGRQVVPVRPRIQAADGSKSGSSSGSSPATPAPKQSKYASPEDWDTFRDVITSLYIKEDKSLRQVREYMERNHNFFATERMYKIRIKAWALRKNNTEATIAALLVLKNQRERAGKKSVYTVHGRPVDWDDIARYLRRKPSIIAKLNAGVLEVGNATGVVARTPSPDPVQMLSVAGTMTDGVQVEVVTLFRDYMSGGLDSGVWRYDPELQIYVSNSGTTGSFKMMCWLTELWEDVINGAPGDAGVVWRINKKLDGLEKMIKEQDPWMFSRLVQAFILLCGWNREVGHMVVRFVAELSEVVLGRGHPLAMAVGRLVGLGLEELKLVMETVGKVRFDQVAETFKKEEIKEVSGPYWVVAPEFDDSYRLRSFLDGLADDLRQRVTTSSSFRCSWVVLHVVLPSIFFGYYDDAEMLMDALDGRIAAAGADDSFYTAIGSAALVRAILYIETGREDEVEPLLRKAINAQAWLTKCCEVMGTMNATLDQMIAPWLITFVQQQPERMARWRDMISDPQGWLDRHPQGRRVVQETE